MLDSMILVTGSDGFIGRNVIQQMSDKYPLFNFLEINSSSTDEALEAGVQQCNLILHFAGTNRPPGGDFISSNENLTEKLCLLAAKYGGKDIIFTSSIHSSTDSEYGISKRNCEEILLSYDKHVENRVDILQLPGVYGKWSKPNYNSVVATFCYNISRDLEVNIFDGEKKLSLLYIDDFVSALEDYLVYGKNKIDIQKLTKIIKINDLVAVLRAFNQGLHKCFDVIEELQINCQIIKNLHSTFISHMPNKKLNFQLKSHSDSRGIFCEIMRGIPFGQLSFITLMPGISRGGHYHHSKVEAFILVHGDVEYSHIDLLTTVEFKIKLRSNQPSAVYTKPGCIHKLTNLNDEIAVVAIWTNENFKQSDHDTYFLKE